MEKEKIVWDRDKMTKDEKSSVEYTLKCHHAITLIDKILGNEISLLKNLRYIEKYKNNGQEYRVDDENKKVKKQNNTILYDWVNPISERTTVNDKLEYRMVMETVKWFDGSKLTPKGYIIFTGKLDDNYKVLNVKVLIEWGNYRKEIDIKWGDLLEIKNPKDPNERQLAKINGGFSNFMKRFDMKKIAGK